ncbi:MAG TPA: CBS domain-containing protein [Solirubrobacteraceae bacterium]|nr:CBS domain-containing protein [Solirubrobacteraceae bacterium]
MSTATPTVHLSSLAGSSLLDSGGQRLGRVTDVVARLDASEPLPPVVGLTASIGGRHMFVPIGRVAELGAGVARTGTTKLNLAQFERRPGEILLRRDVLDRSLINVATAHLVKAREVDLVRQDGVWRVAGVDPSLGPRLQRLLPRRFRTHETEHHEFIPWNQLEAFVAHVPTSRLKLASRRLLRLHPAQIADLVEAASHEEGEEILEAVGQDKELEADVFEELDDEHQVEFLRDRSDQQVAAVLGRMEADDAADLLLEMEQDRRLPILGLLPSGRQAKLRALLGHNPATAGGMMNPDFVSASVDNTIDAVLGQIRASHLGPQQVDAICAVDAEGRLCGLVLLGELVLARSGTRVGDLVETQLPSVTPETDLPEVAIHMSDYNLVALPVVDSDGRPVGMIGVDDVLEQLLPEEWRRRTGAARR